MSTKTWDFPSSSSSDTWTTMYRDGKLSCNCPGWTRRVNPVDGSRHCKHLDKAEVQHYVNTMNGTISPTSTHAPSKPTTVFSHVCSQCGVTYTTLSSLQQHNQQHLADARAARKATVAGQDYDTGESDQPIITRRQRVAAPVVTKASYRPLMLANEIPDGKTVDHYDPEQWVIEQKFDGERVLTSVRAGNVYSWSRAQRDNPEGKVRTLPKHIIDVMATLGDGDYDSEIVVANGKSNDVRRITNETVTTLVIFDALSLGGIDITALSYTERRRRLAIFTQYLKPNGPVIVATAMEPDSEVYEAIVAQGGEGVMLKRMASKYTGGRSDDWLKVKARSEAVVTITGFEAGESGPHSVILFKMPSGVESKCKNKNNDWLRRSQRGSIAIGMSMEIEYQVLMPSGKPRHPMAKRVLSPTEVIE